MPFMKKGKILSSVHLKNMLWLRIQPSRESLRHIDSIARTLDTSPYKEGLARMKLTSSYKSHLPMRWYFTRPDGRDSRKCYAVLIGCEDALDLVLLKEHKAFPLIVKEVWKHFTFKTK